MKHIYKTIIAVLITVSSYSCSAGWLDLTPSDAASLEEAIYDVPSAKVALVGVYNGMKGDSNNQYYYGGGLFYYGDVRGDDMQATKDASRTGWAYKMDYTASLNPNHIWRIAYKTIRRANNLIKAIDAGYVKTGSVEDINDIKAQALTLRALAHFDLLRVYARAYDINKNGESLGIPIVTKVLSANSTPARNSVAEVYKQIETDLDDAIKLGIYKKKQLGYINYWGVKVLQARVHLYKGSQEDLKAAYKICTEEIIGKSPYSLWTNAEYATVWSQENTSEMIFELGITSTQDWVDREGLPYLYSENGYADGVMTKNYLDFVEGAYAGDVRLKLMLKANKDENNTYQGRNVYINKYPGKDDDVRINNMPILRLSEAYTIAAETAMKLGNTVDAAKYLNVIVERGNPNATKLTPATISLDRILDEKRVEFVGEGHRFFDLIRNQKTITRYTTESNIGWHIAIAETQSREFTEDYFRVILPIPEAEILANPIIKNQQNPGY